MAMVVKSAIRGAVKGFRVSGDFFKALDRFVVENVKCATTRAKANGRKTIRACDI